MPTIRSKTVKGRIKVLKATLYKDCMIYIRLIDNDIFMYDAVFKGQIYSSYIVIKSKKDSTRLTKGEINQSAALIFVGATTTIDTLLGERVDKSTEKRVKEFEKISKKFFNQKVVN